MRFETLETLKVTMGDGLCRIAFDRAEVGNAINETMVAELALVLDHCAASEEGSAAPVKVVVLEGGPDVFCAGGDFEAVTEKGATADPTALYDVWLRLAEGPFVSVALVEGRANAGGVGFIAAADIVIATKTASFALAELLFGLYPACVLPFLIRRIGRQPAHRMTLMTRPLTAEEALAAGLIDSLVEDSEAALRQHLLRLRRLQRPAIARYKAYLKDCAGDPARDRDRALAANREMFSDPQVLGNIRRYVTELKFPWET